MVYSYANYLAKKGHKIQIAHTLRFHMGNMSLWRKLIRLAFWLKTLLIKRAEPDWFRLSPEVESTVVLDLYDSNTPSADAVIATAWSTAESVNKLSPDKGTKFYFIQGYENWDTKDVKVNATFKLPLKKIVVSIWLEKMLKSMNEEPIACIPNGLDFEFFKIIKPVEDRLPIKIGMCYSIYKWKGSKDGIEALKIVKERFPQLQAIFFSVCSRNSGIPSWIEYRRNPSPPQLLDIYNSCSIFINPSWSEGWGLPASEAMACGCALISTRNKGAEEFVKDQDTGLLTKVGDPEDMAEKIIKLIESQSLRLKLALTGANFIKKFDLKESAKEFKEAIMSNLNRK